jgi:ACS family tartrate transporter-like MFS transporter
MNNPNTFDNKTMGKVTKRLLPFLMLLYLIAYLDRSNISVAALQMNADLGLSAKMYGLGAGLFYVTYIIFEIPSNVILVKVGARRWIARIMVTWGLVAIGMAFIRTQDQLYGMRLLLGTAEAGFTTGIIYYLSQWFPSDNRAKAMSYFYIAAALASVIGLPLSGGLLELHGVLGFAGWRWLYLIEGIPALILGFVVLKYLPDDIQGAKWLLPEQRKWLSKVINDELKIGREKKEGKWYSIFSNKYVWLLSFFWLLQAFGTIGITLFLPQILKNISGGTDFIISLLSDLPFLFACIFMYFNSKSSDISKERRLHLGIPLLVSGFLLIMSIYTGITITYVLLVASVAMNWAVTPVFWAVTTEYLSSGSVAAGSIAMINAIANIAGATLPYLMGYIRDITGNYDYALWMVGIALIAGGILGISVAQKVAVSRLVIVQEASK